MSDITEQKYEANQLRKNKKYKEALPLYRNLWEETEDKFNGTGFLQCLRKLKIFDQAIIFANELIVKYPDFEWCRYEVIWTYIQGILAKLGKEEPLRKIVEVANMIMRFNPKGLAAKLIVFKVLKSAKSSDNWGLINEWVIKLDPATLSDNPMKDISGREGWSDRALWYNYRIKGLIKQKNPKEAIKIIDEILDQFPKQRKFFLRLKALANFRLGDLSESEKIYHNLCNVHKPEWWILHEYAKVVRDIGRKEESLKLMYQAANSNSKLGPMVSLFQDIGNLCWEMRKNEEARAHLLLCKYIRNEKGWTVSEDIIKNIDNLNEAIGNNKEPSSLKAALNICRSEWVDFLGEKGMQNKLTGKKRKIKRGLIGKVSSLRDDRPFCFIITEDGKSYFCSKSALPPNTENSNTITFDAVPSFDKKKSRESWKALNIRHK